MSTYRIQSYKGTGLFLNVYGTGTITGRRNVCIWKETSSSDQKWSITSLGSNVLVKSMNNQNYALNAKTDTWNCDVMTVNSDSYVNFQVVDKSAKLYLIQLVSNTAKYLTAEGTANNSNVSWAARNTSSDAQVWKVFEDAPVTPPVTGEETKIPMPAGKNCNWNQFYTPLVNTIGSTQGCTFATALDLMNFYGPSSYTPEDAKPGWNGGVVWGTAWKGNFRAGARSVYSSSSSDQAKAFTLMRSQIDLGRPVIVNVGTGNNNNHTVMCYGYKNGGTSYADFLVMDPAGNGKTDTENPNGKERTLEAAMKFSSKTSGIWSMRLTESKA